ncbi:unnamed protein product [Symbiodinium natans]|uniref:Uncharacterized protein n=1 Tax=Symbiodinium natans TaxID=878477 RepID=A0A812LXU2_9DINO|nr:unnamed protein product [Symbiodinium natans]
MWCQRATPTSFGREEFRPKSKGVLTLPSAALPGHLRLSRSLAVRLQRVLADAVDVSPIQRAGQVKPLPALAVTMPNAVKSSPRKGLVLSGWERKEVQVLDAILEPSVGPERQVAFEIAERCDWEQKAHTSCMDEDSEGEPLASEPCTQSVITGGSDPRAPSPKAMDLPGGAAAREEPPFPEPPVPGGHLCPCAQPLPPSQPSQPSQSKEGASEAPSEAALLAMPDAPGRKKHHRGSHRAKHSQEGAHERFLATQPTMVRYVSEGSSDSSGSESSEELPQVQRLETKRMMAEALRAGSESPESPDRAVRGREMRPPRLVQWPKRLHNAEALPRATRLYREPSPVPTPAAVRFAAKRERRFQAVKLVHFRVEGWDEFPPPPYPPYSPSPW